MELDRPHHAAGSVSQRPDIRGGLAGPGTELGMGLRTGMLMMAVGRRRMGEDTTGRHQGQRHVDPGDTECDTGQGFVEGQSIHRLCLSRDQFMYALSANLSTDGCSRMLHNHPFPHISWRWFPRRRRKGGTDAPRLGRAPGSTFLPPEVDACHREQHNHQSQEAH